MFVDVVNLFGSFVDVGMKYRMNWPALSCSTNEPDAGGVGRSARMEDKSGRTALRRI